METFIFLTSNKDVISKVKAGIVPAGYYDIQSNWNGEEWVTVYRYYEFNSIDDAPEMIGPWIDEFRPEAFRVSECGALSLSLEC